MSSPVNQKNYDLEFMEMFVALCACIIGYIVETFENTSNIYKRYTHQGKRNIIKKRLCLSIV